MIPGSFVGLLADRLKIERKELIEKDLYLQGILLELADSGHFSENFAFKGGTCLTKAYFGYHRFSEDLDFTWMDQKAFEGKSKKEVRRLLSDEIDGLLDIFSAIAEKLGLKFRPVKSERHYVELGGSNRFVTFKLWYESEILGTGTFIKVQINFVEKIIHRPEKKGINAIAPPEMRRELEFLYPEFSQLAVRSPTLFVYDLKEIAAEKIRALLTRRGFKLRDIIDLHIISKNGVSIESVEELALEKTKFMLGYEKYSSNLLEKNFEEFLKPGEEKKLVIRQLGEDFGEFAEKTINHLNRLAEKLKRGNRGV